MPGGCWLHGATVHNFLPPDIVDEALDIPRMIARPNTSTENGFDLCSSKAHRLWVTGRPEGGKPECPHGHQHKDGPGEFIMKGKKVATGE